jgi:hypothetical protein
MKPAALGFRVHSGWTALVAVSLEEGFPIALLRDRPHLVRTFTFEFRQPYHTAEKRPFEQARDFIAQMRTEAQALAAQVIQSARSDLRTQGYELQRCGLLTASAKPLPGLDRILASHALIHTADGELFREALLHACRQHALETVTVKEKELLERAGQALQLSANEIAARLASLGRTHGSPWTQDEKFATLAACLSLLS